MSPLVPILLGLAGAVITAVGAYAVAKRQRSGKIVTTEAEVLWAEGQAMRKELREENLGLRAEVLALRAEVTAWRVEALALRSEVALLRRHVLEIAGGARLFEEGGNGLPSATGGEAPRERD